MGQIDFSPLWVTLKTGIVASVFSFFIGIAFAELVINTKGRVRAFWDGLLTLPMVLPPTVAGYILLRIFSTRDYKGYMMMFAAKEMTSRLKDKLENALKGEL